MNKITIRKSLALVALLAATTAVTAQTSPAPNTMKSGEATTMQGGVPNPSQKAGGTESRADVKAEAAAANKAGTIPTGEASTTRATNNAGNPNPAEKVGPQNTRAAVKGDIQSPTARNSKSPTKAGEASTMVGGQPNMAPTNTSGTSRADVKANTTTK